MSKSPRSRRVAWNQGKIVGQKPPLKIKEVWAIRVRLQLAQRSRDLALFNLAIDSKLRGCDAVNVGVEDVLLSGTLRSRASVVQKKTGKPVTFEVTEQTRSAIQGWLHQLGGRQRGPLFPSRLNPKRSIRPANMHGWSTAGLRQLVLIRQRMEPIHCAGPKQH